MAASRASQQIEWSTADTKDLTTTAPDVDSDAVTLAASTVAASVTLKADNQGTPADGDYVDFYLLATTGDPDVDPDSADEYDSPVHAQFLARLDTYGSGEGEDPALKTVAINPAIKAFKIRGESNAASNTIRVSAQLYEIKA